MKPRSRVRYPFIVIAVVLPLALAACNGFTFRFSFVIPRQAIASSTETAAFPPGAGLVVVNDSGSTRVTVDPSATQATVEITRVAYAQTQEEAADLLDEIEVTIQEPDAENANLRITARRPPAATDDTSHFEFDFDDDEFNITGIVAAHTVALMRLRITIPAGHTVQVTQDDGPVRALFLDAPSNLTTTNGPVRTTAARADLTLRTTNGSVDVEDHVGSLDISVQNGGLDLGISDLAADDDVLATTRNGNIDLNLAHNIDAVLDARTENGSVQFVSGEFDAVSNLVEQDRRVTATLNGGGPTVTVSTGNGDVEIDGR